MPQPANCRSLLEAGNPRKKADCPTAVSLGSARANPITFLWERQMSTIVLSLDKPNDGGSGFFLICLLCFAGALLSFAGALSSPELAETLTLLN
jgi:hypothetical protein